MTPYRVFIEARVLAALRELKRSEQQRILRLFEHLGRNPFQQGDYAEHDEVGRPVQVLVLNRHAVVFWADHPVKEVKILDLKPAGN